MLGFSESQHNNHTMEYITSKIYQIASVKLVQKMLLLLLLLFLGCENVALKIIDYILAVFETVKCHLESKYI